LKTFGFFSSNFRRSYFFFFLASQFPGKCTTWSSSLHVRAAAEGPALILRGTGIGRPEEHRQRKPLKGLLSSVVGCALGSGGTFARVTRFGRNFARWATFFILGSFSKLQKKLTLKAIFYTLKVYALIAAKKWVGLHFGRLFHKLVRSP
jgi:hypothetical protein